MRINGWLWSVKLIGEALVFLTLFLGIPFVLWLVAS